MLVPTFLFFAGVFYGEKTTDVEYVHAPLELCYSHRPADPNPGPQTQWSHNMAKQPMLL